MMTKEERDLLLVIAEMSFFMFEWVSAQQAVSLNVSEEEYRKQMNSMANRLNFIEDAMSRAKQTATHNHEREFFMKALTKRQQSSFQRNLFIC